MTCTTCGAENRAGRKFCSKCGSALAFSCPNCGAANEPGDRFCGECGHSLEPAAAEAAETFASGPERRLVSILFTDLVGFTTLSESRDAEDVRELLSHYFESARRIVERYGGTIEKFIGDAVMAVWGSPVAREDDAERAVRAGLDLVAAVSALGTEQEIPSLAARAGVATGEAAVDRAAEGQFRRAERIFLEIGDPFRRGQHLLAHAEWLATAERSGEALVVAGDAAEIFRMLRATPWIERAEKLSPAAVGS